MAQLYSVTVDQIALVAATAKSIFELNTAAQVPAKIVEWWVDFDGVTSTAIPVLVRAAPYSAAVTTATTQAGTAWQPGQGTPASVTKHSTTVEGAGTVTTAAGWAKRIHPQSGFHYQAPLGREYAIAINTFWRIVCTAAANVNVSFGVIWEE